ncbi:hypothetical protein RYX36_024710 [Vicia faba]
MAEQMVYVVAENLIKRLASAAFREFGRIYGVMDELESLRKTFELIKDVLLDAEDKQQQNRAIQIWITRLKDDVFHPADNLLDEFLIQDMSHKTQKNKMTKVLHSFSTNKIVFRSRTAHEIEKIQKKCNDIAKDMFYLNLNPNLVVVEHSNNVKRETSSFVFESDITGREDDKKKIISLLRQSHDENHHVSVVAIVGIGGLGKTALAQLVYNDREVKDMFEKSMWVCVSDNFDVKTIVKTIIESLTDSKIGDTLPLENLHNMLCDNLTGKKYLLFLDDIWNENAEKWARLRTSLMCGAQGSKIVVTTRSKIVAQTMGVSVPYILNGLNSIESWSLLKNIVTYGDEIKVVNQKLESIGKKIVEKCSGVPLAIKMLGGLLRRHSKENEWIAILHGDFWKSQYEKSIIPVLKLSYQNLSPRLKQCFAYCSLYPKDWEIPKDELIQLWMAQGYLEFSNEKQTMEDIGNQFVNIFFMLSFFRDVHFDDDGNLFHFKIHDLIHDLAMHVAGNDCCYLDSETKRVVGSPMHVMLKSDAIGLSKSMDASRMRTLIFLSKHQDIWNEKELPVNLKFKYLHALKLSYCSISKSCDSIGKLKHLRYLKLCYCVGLEDLFKSIGNIVCLQTLILEGCEGVEFSTKDILSLFNLRHLHIENLKAFKEKKTTAGFGKLSLGEWYKSLTFSNWLSSLTNIVEIFLIKCQGVQYLQPIERLPFLKSLVIDDLHELEYIYYEESLLTEAFFPSLEVLRIFGCEKLKGWWRVRDDIIGDDNSSQSYHLSFFPCLSYLTIIDCPMLTHMPTFPNLYKKFVFWNCKMDALEATLNMVKSNGSIAFLPLSMLKDLFLGGHELDVKALPNDWMENLTSLKHLVFYDIPNQTFHEIEICFKDKLICLPSLQKIEISDCSDLEAFPVWICNIPSLQHIIISECKILASLPDGMPRLAKLQTLEIIECPLLIEECRTETSATWSKIAHIPNIILK